MPRIDITFILLSVLCLTTGLVLGMNMGAAHDFQLAPVHAHLNLLGWTSLALFGLIYRSYPALQASWLAKAHLVLSGVSAFGFPAGIYLSIVHERPGLAVGMAFVALAGVLTFFANLVRVFFFSAQSAPSTAGTPA
ncbi:hypothetical protein [Microvirga thermotolerans]|uniref:Cytochrome-c oxidase n=1 Tax=Microvirga thermotolerans TaxID=2651334 RepID=A0A5P9JT93_9HYPH|nr:hypothetical protein [Microvirga thermotolerans]QFU16032.1 hypothetical protein GDR74_07225 [Microvirga thermotolerans]